MVRSREGSYDKRKQVPTVFQQTAVQMDIVFSLKPYKHQRKASLKISDQSIQRKFGRIKEQQTNRLTERHLISFFL